MGNVNEEFATEHTPPLGMASVVPSAKAAQEKTQFSGEATFIVESPSNESAAYQITNLSNGHTIAITEPLFTIGRSDECSIVLDDKKISKLHARIVSKGGQVALEDAGSANGVFVNGHRIKRALLVEHDLIQLGDQKLSFDTQPAAGGGPALGTRVHEKAAPNMTRGAALVNMLFRKRPLVAGTAAAVALLIALVGYLLLGTRGAHVVASGQVMAPGSVERTVADEPAHNDVSTSTVVEAQSHKVDAVPTDAATSDTSQEGASPAVEAPARVRYVSSQVSRAQIEQARKQYLGGHAGEALDALGAVVAEATHRPAHRQEADKLAKALRELYGAYSAGLTSYQADDHNKAFDIWDRFVKDEQIIFASETSRYAQRVAEMVAAKYLALGRQAIEAEDRRSAYAYLRASAQVQPDGEAIRLLDELRVDAARIYNDAYRNETSDLELAKKLWNKVISMTPSDDEYHARSSAKLQWYARWGR